MRESIMKEINAIVSKESDTDLSRMISITRDIIGIFEKEIAHLTPAPFSILISAVAAGDMTTVGASLARCDQ